MTKAIVTALAVVLALPLGALQIVSTIALRADAAPGAWVHLLPSSAGTAIDDLDPALPLPGTLRLVLARSALARGNDALAAAHAARLGDSRDRYALLGTLAAHRGDVAEAVKDALTAGDLPALEGYVDALAAKGRAGEAIRLQEATVTRLTGDRADGDALAESYFRLGLLRQTLAYQKPVVASRGPDQAASYEAYLRAVDLAPLSARYLLGAGSEALNVGDLRGAHALFERARVSDPTNAAALAGLGEVALREADRSAAESYLERADRVAPQSPEVGRLRAELSRSGGR